MNNLQSFYSRRMRGLLKAKKATKMKNKSWRKNNVFNSDNTKFVIMPKTQNEPYVGKYYMAWESEQFCDNRH